MQPNQEQRDRQKLLRYIQKKGGTLTARALQHSGRRRFHFVFHCEEALNELERLGYGRFFDVPTTARGGRPTKAFTLFKPATTTAAA